MIFYKGRNLAQYSLCDFTDREISLIYYYHFQAVISHQRLENCSSTVTIISQLMAADPRRMHQHILRTMFRQSRCYHVSIMIRTFLFHSSYHPMLPCLSHGLSFLPFFSLIRAVLSTSFASLTRCMMG